MSLSLSSGFSRHAGRALPRSLFPATVGPGIRASFEDRDAGAAFRWSHAAPLGSGGTARGWTSPGSSIFPRPPRRSEARGRGFVEDGGRRFGGTGEKGGKDGEDAERFTHEVEIKMPEVGDDAEGMGVIQRWYKKEGDIIKRDEVICDIRTELFTFGMSTDDEYDSIMGDILIEEESGPIAPGTVICTTFNEGQHENAEGGKDD